MSLDLVGNLFDGLLICAKGVEEDFKGRVPQGGVPEHLRSLFRFELALDLVENEIFAVKHCVGHAGNGGEVGLEDPRGLCNGGGRCHGGDHGVQRRLQRLQEASSGGVRFHIDQGGVFAQADASVR